MNAHLTKLLMYHQIHKMSREGLSVSKICRLVNLNWRTVRNYLSRTEASFELYLTAQTDRSKELQPFEKFVKGKLELYQDTSAAQMHDWLKEHCSEFPVVSPKTVFNFVAWVRQKYHLPKIRPIRAYEMVEELAYGKQSQADFGEYHLRDNQGKSVKVFFYTMVLSRSRYKYVWFTRNPFTSELSIQGHEQAFAYFQGVTDEVVYDQDKVFLVDENKGDLMLTEKFKAYTRDKAFRLHFCRKSDPESKGKVENVVKYVKQNFLYNRPFFNLETLNEEVLAWLKRTANRMPHHSTKREPDSEWEIERAFLKPHSPCILPAVRLEYSLRKDNSISWKSNFYSLPLGSYTGRGTRVLVEVRGNLLVLFTSTGTELCRHTINPGNGMKIKNSDHARDKTSKIGELINQLCAKLEHPEHGIMFFEALKKDKPRYVRDQLLIFEKAIQHADRHIVSQALEFCCTEKIVSAADFKAKIADIQNDKKMEIPGELLQLNPLNGQLPLAALVKPQISNIADYQKLF